MLFLVSLFQVLENIIKFSHFYITDKPNNITTLEEGKLMLEAINGFVIHLDRKKTIMYISENVKSYLGLKQVRW